MIGAAAGRRGAAVGTCAVMRSGMGVGDGEVGVMVGAGEAVKAV